MTRDLKRLADTAFDVVVVGAGIYGVAIAWDAAERGLSVALVDRGDFGGATSFNNHKTVHGGLRSLQHGNLREMREFIRERRALSRIVPHLVHPLPFLVPTGRGLLRSQPSLGIALLIHNLVGRDRNNLADPSKHLPAGHLISRDECLLRFPGLRPAEVTGGAIWHDCQMYNPDRVTLSFVLSGYKAGVAALNYVEATGLLGSKGRVEGILGHDMLSGQSLDIRARIVINAAGPWAGEILRTLARGLTGGGHDSAPALAANRLSRAMNLVIRKRLATDHALGGLANGRFLFLLPWRDVNVVGTSHDPHDGGAGDLHVRWADVDRLIAHVNQAFPSLALERDDVRLVHRGLLPMTSASGGHVRLLKDSQVRDHRADGLTGLVSVLGVRYTTARATAERTVDLAFEILGRTPTPCRTAETPLEGGDITNFMEFKRQREDEYRGRIDPDTLRRLILSYGSGLDAVLSSILADDRLARPLSDTCPVTHGEILHAVRHEMAVALSDAVLRRTEAGSAGHPGRTALQAAAAMMASERGWDAARTDREIASVEAFYRIED
jgi:glycerol-3-phosphate dehydrogenase